MKYARIAVFALLAVSFAAASTPEGSTTGLNWQTVEKNYIAALQSNNAGVQASAAHFIRKYNLTGAVNDLKNVLCKDCPEKVKMSVAYALISVGGEEGRHAVEKAILTEENELVVIFYKSILHSTADNEG
ncbi:MAG: hypothetical protein WCT99_08750 [Bacteroidota bacterium]|jgi:hypothetical protein